MSEYLPVAQVFAESANVPLVEMVAADRLLYGWNPLRRSKGKAFIWSRGGNATMDLALVAPGELSLKLDLGSPPHPKDRTFPQRVRALWNGVRIGDFDIEPDNDHQAITLAVPREAQRYGMNRLELFPSIWVDPYVFDNTFPAYIRGAGFRIWSIDFEGAGVPVESGGPYAFVQGDTIGQAAATVMSYHFILPQGAVFRSRARVVISGATPELKRGLSGRVAVSVTNARGVESSLYERDVDGSSTDEAIEISGDLSQLSGQPVEISFAFTVDEATKAALGPGVDVHVEWLNPRIEGVSPAVGESDAPTPVPEEPYNVMVFLFDTLRPDYLAPYGSDTLTPNVTRLSEMGATFMNTSSNSSWTRTAVASLLSGTYPATHGVVSTTHKVPSGVPFLPEILQQSGYKTVGISNNGNLTFETGFDRGFDHFHEFFRLRNGTILKDYRTPDSQAEYVWDHYISPVIEEAGDAPFFVYLHEVDPHAPYDPPPPYDALYPSPYRGVVKGEHDMFTLEGLNAMKLSGVELEHLRTRYQGEVSFIDAYLGWMMAKFEEEGLTKNTLIIFTSDHGEEFYEHDGLGHYWTLFEESLRVPLIMVMDGVITPGRTVETHSQLVDLMPTILKALGKDSPSYLPGESLLRYVDSEVAREEPDVSFAKVRWKRHAESIRYGDWKLIRKGFGGVVECMLFNLADDPGEEINVWANEPVLGRALYQMLQWNHLKGEESLAEIEEFMEGEVDEETRQNLEALGYIN